MDYPMIAFILHQQKRQHVVLQSASGKLYNDPLISANGQILIYLINSSTRDTVSPEHCASMTRTAKASVALGSLNMCKCINEMKQRFIPS